VEHEKQRVTLRGKHGGEVVGWAKPRLSEEEEAAIRERLIQRRFEHVDKHLARIGEHLRQLAELGAVDLDTVSAIYEARMAVMKLSSLRMGPTTRR
jgi:hypothetical protein